MSESVLDLLFHVAGIILLLVIVGYFALQCITWEDRMERSLPYITDLAEKVCQREFNTHFQWEWNSSCIEVPGVHGSCKDDEGKVYARIKCYDVGTYIRCAGKSVTGEKIEWEVEK